MKLSPASIKALIQETIAAREKAYAPYSKFKVGALVIDSQGQKTFGVNVENASYGLSNCAERSAIFASVSHGMTKIATLVVVGDTDGPIEPCGACRQVMVEFTTEKTQIILANLKGDYKVLSMDELLPLAFSPKSLGK